MNRFRAVFIIALLSLATVALATTNYAVDFNAANKGYVSVPKVNFGESGAISVLFKLFKNDNNPFYIHASADFSDSDKTLLLITVYNNKVIVQVGDDKESFSFTSGTGKWNDYAITIRNAGSGSAVEVFVNELPSKKGTLNSRIVTGKREIFFNAYKNKNGVLNGFTNSRMDDFVILDTIASAQTRKMFRANPSSPSDRDLTKLAVWINFDDALAFQTNSRVTTAITSVSSSESEWIEAVLHKGASYVSFTNQNFKQCYATGDPHLRIMPGHSEASPRLEHTYGHNLWASCDYVEIRYYTRYTKWWGATVFRAFGIRVRDTVFRLNLNEFDPNERSGKGHLASRLNIPFGFYKKNLYSKSWDTIPSSKSYRYDDESGTIYRYYGNVVTISVPNVIEVTVNSFTPSARYMNLYTKLNQANCAFGEGSCFGDHFEYKDVMFRDYLPLPPLPDVQEPEIEPCDGVPTQVQNDITKICKTVAGGSVTSDDFLNCRYDACLSGDINIINLIEPTPSCLQAAATGEDADPACFNGQCKFFCSFRGECFSNNTCGCIAGYDSIDNCYTPDYYGCYKADYNDGRQISIAPKYYLQSRGQPTITEGFVDDVKKYSLPNSVNIVPYYDNNDDHYLAVVVNSASSPESGSVDICITKESLTLVKSASEYYSKKSFKSLSGDKCYSVKFRSYEQVMLLFKAGVEIETGLTQTFTLENVNNINQFLFSSYLQDRDEVLVTKIPRSKWSEGFKIVMKTCTGDTCRRYTDCETCVADTNCGFCLEKGVCIEGDRTGPYFGSCQNWRFNLGDSVSRVVTVTYTQDDLTNPDTDVFITSADSSALPVNVIVPTTTASQFDVSVFLSTLGTYASNAQQLKENLLEALYSLSSNNINLALGHYSGNKAVLGISMTRVQENMHFRFGEALATPKIGFEGEGGQHLVLKKAASSSVGYRKFARRVVFMTVYDLSDVSKIRDARSSVFDKSLLPVFLVSGPKKQANGIMTTLRNEVFDNSKGFPGLVFYLEENGQNFRSVFEAALKLSASLPAVILDESSNLDHVDTALLTNEHDTTYIVGAVSSDMRARFVIPMKRPSGDDSYKTAKIAIPGYGVSEITDVDRGLPTGKDFNTVGKEGSECIPVNLRGNTFKNLIAPLFRVSHNVQSEIGEFYYQSVDGDIVTIAQGSEVTLTPAESKVCFKPGAHRHSTFNSETGQFDTYASLTYKVFDGCIPSEQYTVDIVVTPVFYAPEFTVEVAPITEGSVGQHNIEINISDNDFVSPDFTRRESVSITFGDFNVDYEPLFHDISGVNFFPAVTPGEQQAVTLPADWDTNNLAIFNVVFEIPSSMDQFFGTVTLPFELEDENGLTTEGKIVVQVTNINDAPEIYPIAENQVVGNEFYVFVDEGNGADFTISARDIDSYTWSISATITYPSENVDASVDGTLISQPNQVICSASHSTSLDCHVESSPHSLPDFYSCDSSSGSPTTPADCDVRNESPLFTITVVANDGVDTVTKDFVVHVVNVNDPPQRPVVDQACFAEDESRDFPITVTDADFDENLELDITAVSPGIILTHVDGSDIGPLPARLRNLKRSTTEQFVVRAKLAPHQHGDPSNEFSVGTFQLRAVDLDGEFSEIATATVCVYPVNDAPEQLIKSHKMREDSQSVLDLTVRDIDTPASDITYVLTEVPQNITVFACGADTIVDEPIVAGENIPACEDGSTQVVLVPDADWYGQATLSYKVTDTDMFTTPLPPVTHTVDFNVDISVAAVNDAPETYLPAIEAQEDTPVVIDLQAVNNRFGEESDVVVVEITRNLYGDSSNGLGKLYQYTAACETGLATGVDSACVEIDSVPTVVSSGSVIYMPPKHANSETTTLFEDTHYLVKPHFDFRARETSSHAAPELLTSLDNPVSIFVSRVNDVPVSYGYDLSEFVGELYMLQDSLFPITTECVDDCVYEEDFGAEYPYTAGDEEIYFWGFDIEGAELSVFINSIECKGELKRFAYKNGFEWTEVEGSDVSVLAETFLKSTIPSNTFEPVPLLSFSPALDAHSPEGENFCTIKYSLFDGYDYSDISTINVNINSANDAPRPTNGFDNTFNGVEDSLSLVYANAEDLEGEYIKFRVVECKGPGRFYFPTEALASRVSDNGESVDISGLEDPVAELFESEAINCDDKPVFEVTNEVFTNGWFIGYLPPTDNVETAELKITYLDVNGVESVAIVNTILITPVNDAPIVRRGEEFIAGDKTVLAFNGKHLENPQVDGEVVIETVYQTSSIFPLSVADSEAEAYDAEITYALIPVTNEAECNFRVIIKNVGDRVEIEGNYRTVQKQLKGLSFECDKTGVSVYELTVSDNGASGICPVMIELNENGQCERVSKVRVEIRSSDAPLSVAAAALSGAGAGAFVLLAIAGAAAAAFMKKKENDAQPWNEWDGELGDYAHQNPLHESATVGGTNPLAV